jgi:eukaryotic-like serine/threonine-protein kinase
MACESTHDRPIDHIGLGFHRVHSKPMSVNEQNTDSDSLGPTEPEARDLSDPIAAILERTRGDELDFDGEFEQQRLMQTLFNQPPQDQTIGRFVVRQRLGSGGMGEVYRAWDPRLDRDVALKLLRASVQRGSSTHILDEARALAKVEHDNVVRVYDVDIHGDRPYLTMEVIEGRTLARWLKRNRDVSAIVAVFVRAGAGLRAIHEAGLVHGDFKPRNVLIGEDGRVRVADFGLASTVGSADEGGAASDPRQPAGTRGYLAPEQFESAPPSPASDQFSFCVALFEAVFGELPFPRRDADELRDSIERCELQFPEITSPRWLRQLLARGLARNPAARYPDMAALLAELGRDRSSTKRRYLGIATAVSLVATIGALAAWLMPGPTVPVQDPLAGVWDAEQREQLESVFSTIDESWAPGALTTVTLDLDRWAKRWRHRWFLAPEPRRDCLEDQRLEALAIVERLVEADPVRLRAAPELTAQLADPSRCFDAPVLVAPNHAEHQRLRQLLASAIVERVTGDVDAADELLEQTIAGAREQGDTALEIDALRERAQIRINQGRRAEAIEQLRAAIALATEFADWRRVAHTYVELAWSADDMTSAALRREWLDQAQAHVTHLGTDRDAQLATMRISLTRALEFVTDESESTLRKLITELDTLDVDRSLLAIQIHHGLAGLLAGQGAERRVEADAMFERSLEVATLVWGTDHPEVAKIWSDYGIHAMRYGDTELARSHFSESLRLREAALTPPHPLLARSHVQLAQLELGAGQIEQAKRHAKAAAANVSADLDQDRAAEIWRVMGQIAFIEKDITGAITHYRRSLAAASTDPSMDRGLTELALASALFLDGKCAEANPYFQNSLEFVEREIVPVNPSLLVETWSAHIQSLDACGEHERADAEAIRVSAYLDDSEEQALIQQSGQ